MKLNWREYVLYVTAMGMEGCALYTLLTLLNKQVAGGRLFIFEFLLLYLLSFGFNQVLRWPRAFRYPLNGLVWAIAMLIMVKTQLYSQLGFSDSAWLLALPQAIADILYTFEPELLILLGSAVAWWLGWHLAHIRTVFASLVAEFQFTLATILIVLFVASPLNIQIDNSILITLFFFIFALLGMSIAHGKALAG